MSKFKAAQVPIKDLRQAILNGSSTISATDLLSVIDAEKISNYDNINFVSAWSKLFNNQLRSISAGDLSEGLYHLGRLEYYDDNLLRKAVDAVKSRSSELGYKEISQCLYGLGKLKFFDQEFLDLITQRFLDCSGPIETADIANLIFGVHKFEYYNQRFLDKFATNATEKINEFDSQDISKILLGIAKIGYHNQVLLGSLIGKTNEFIIKFDEQSLSNSAFALTMILKINNPDDPENIKDLIVELAQKIDYDQVETIEGKHQLIKVYYALDEGRREGLRDLEKKIDNVWNKEIEENAKDTATISSIQTKMALYTSKLVRDIQEEYYIKELGTGVDIYLSSINTVIQVDGPHHFHAPDRLDYNAATNFNSARIEELGYNLLRVPTGDLNYEQTIKNCINAQLSEVRQKRKTNTYLSKNKAKEIGDDDFEAIFDGLTISEQINEAIQPTSSSVAPVAEKVAKKNTSKKPIVQPSKTLSKKEKEQLEKQKKLEEDALFEELEAEAAKERAALPIVPKEVEKFEEMNKDLKNGNNRLHLAASNPNPKIAAYYISQGININAQNNDKQTPRHIAFSKENFAVFVELLAAGAEVTPQFCELAMIKCIENDQIEAVQELLKRGVSADVRENNLIYHSPILLRAVRTKNYKMVETLLDAGANPNAAGDLGHTALDIAASIETKVGTEIVKLLLDRGTHPNTARSSGQTPLLTACASNQDSAILILKAGASPNVVDKKNVSSLHYASMNGNKEIVKRIITDGQVDINMKMNLETDHSTAIQLAMKKGHLEIVMMLEDAIEIADKKNNDIKKTSERDLVPVQEGFRDKLERERKKSAEAEKDRSIL